MSHLNSTRRSFLHGVGALLALPPMESAQRWWKPQSVPGNALAVSKNGAPLRMGFIGFPNGALVAPWVPTGVGKDFKLGETLQPLVPYQSRLQQFSGYMQDGAFAHGDGAGDHARANACYLTGVHPLKTSGANIKLGISVDQVAAKKVGHLTRLPSLELGTEPTRKSGSCDNGYSCAYQYNMSWASETLPMAPDADPRQAFERLFGTGNGKERQQHLQSRLESRRSVIDLVLNDARSLKSELGINDQRKMDEYLSSIRIIEQQIEKSERFTLPTPSMDKPTNIPKDHGVHVRLMYDLMALAFHTDSTRVATFLLSHDGSNRSFQEIGIPEGHHALSNHQNNPDSMAKIARIDKFYVEQFAYFLQKLDTLKDIDGSSVLDNSMVMYGGAHSDGNKHRHNNLPIVLAGGGGGRLNTGRHVAQAADTPLNNLFLGMLEHMGANPGKLGDSTAVETNL